MAISLSKVADIRSGVVDAMGNVPGWSAYRGVPTTFSGDPEGMRDRVYAVDVPATRVFAGRGSPSSPRLVETTVVLRLVLAAAEPPHAERYDAALDAELAVVAAVEGAMHALTLVSIDRRLREGWILMDLTFRATHYLPL